MRRLSLSSPLTSLPQAAQWQHSRSSPCVPFLSLTSAARCQAAFTCPPAPAAKWQLFFHISPVSNSLSLLPTLPKGSPPAFPRWF
ncbi:hypothetical protein FF1_019341 [Malus domestica]